MYDLVETLVTFGQIKKIHRTMTSALNARPGNKILDVGCGTGLLTAEIAATYPETEVTGIDASPEMVLAARKKRGRANCSFRTGLGEQLPFDDGSFDHVVSSLFFHHVNESLKLKCLEEIYRVLKTGGLVLIGDMGPPYTIGGKIIAYSAWILLRQPEIKENIDGLVPICMRKRGFSDVEEIGKFIGYTNLLRGVKK